MIGKIMTPKSNKAEGLVKSVFERFSFVNLSQYDGFYAVYRFRR